MPMFVIRFRTLLVCFKMLLVCFKTIVVRLGCVKIRIVHHLFVGVSDYKYCNSAF